MSHLKYASALELAQVSTIDKRPHGNTSPAWGVSSSKSNEGIYYRRTWSEKAMSPLENFVPAPFGPVLLSIDGQYGLPLAGRWDGIISMND